MTEQLALGETGTTRSRIDVRQALVSACGRYRYTLSRIWDPALPVAVFIGLNPSVADADRDDPTSRRYNGFARAWGLGGWHGGNLFAWRTTDPRLLPRDRLVAVGPENGHHLGRLLDVARAHGGPVVCAWGNRGAALGSQALDLIELRGLAPQALHLTAERQPSHVLYLRGNLRPRPLAELLAEAA